MLLLSFMPVVIDGGINASKELRIPSLISVKHKIVEDGKWDLWRPVDYI